MENVEKKRKPLGLPAKILIGTVLGLLLGWFTGEALSDIRVIGDVFIRLVQMSIPLLILGAVTEAIGSIDRKSVGKIGGKSIAFFIVTAVVAGIVSIIIAFIIRPGGGLHFDAGGADVVVPEIARGISDIVLGFFGTNIIASLSSGTIIHIIVFAVFFGLALGEYTSRTGNRTLLDNISSFNKILMGMIRFIMNFAPIAVFCIMVWVGGNVGFEVVGALVMYLLGLVLVLVVYQTIFFVSVSAYVGVSPLKTFKKCSKAMLIACTTTSSAMALPTAMDDSVKKLGASQRIANIVNPLGISLNADGQMMFTTFGIILMFNILGLDIPFGTLVHIIVIGTLATFGVIAVPGGALVVLMALLPEFGIPVEAVMIIAGVDWFRGMITTPANISGDMLAAFAIAKSENEFYKEVFDEEMTSEEAEQKYAATAGKVVTA